MRFKHMKNQLGMHFICYDNEEILLGTFADADGIEKITEKLNELDEEVKQLQKEKQELIQLVSESTKNTVELLMRKDEYD